MRRHPLAVVCALGLLVPLSWLIPGCAGRNETCSCSCSCEDDTKPQVEADSREACDTKCKESCGTLGHKFTYDCSS